MSAAIAGEWTPPMFVLFIATPILAAVGFRYDEQEGDKAGPMPKPEARVIRTRKAIKPFIKLYIPATKLHRESTPSGAFNTIDSI